MKPRAAPRARSAGARRRSAPSPAARPAAERAPEIFRALHAAWPDAHCELDHRDAFQLLCATILSAQCTDVRVNLVTPALFGRYPTPFALAAADPAELEEIIRSTGFYRNKAKALAGMARALVAEHDGVVPRDMQSLRQLPGVGRKTANVVLGNAFGINDRIVVDTHVTRLSRLLRLTRAADPEEIERDLMKLFPPEDWALLSHLFITHGRRVCIARRPRCADCVIATLCPSRKD